MSKTLKSQAIHGLSWSLADKLINQLGSLAVTIYLARLIGPESFGFIGMLMIFMLLAESVISGGFMQALVQRSKDLTEADSSTIFYVNMLWGLVMYVVLYVSAPFIAAFYRQPVLEDISRILFLVVIVNSLSIVARAKLTIAIDFKSQTIVGTIATLLSSSIAIWLAYLDYGYWALVWLILLKAFFTTVGLWFFCRWLPKLIFSRDSLKSLLGFGSYLMVAGFVATFVNNLYVALVGRYFSATNVGYFTQSVNLTNALSGVISSTLQGVTYPIMTSVKEDKERLVSIYKQLISITMLFSLPVLVGFAAIADSFVKLFLGDEWLAAIPLIVALSLARTITPISSINMNILNAVGRSDLFLKVDLSKLPMTLAALFIAIPFGIEALAWAMVTTSFIAFFINAYYPYKLFNFGPIKQLKIAFNYILASGVMYIVVVFVSICSGVLELVLKIAIGAVAYTLFLWLRKDEFFMKVVGEIVTKMKLRKRFS
ncbi:MAG: lipopolysaccharide biosynthesis protein [Sulfurospirillum sp.]|nr:lipopolysaccharide biosynthesis protein [Sulfurospirillum sp.]